MRSLRIIIVTILALMITISTMGTTAYAASTDKSTKSKISSPEIGVMSTSSRIYIAWDKVPKAKKYEVAYKKTDKKTWKKAIVSKPYINIKASSECKYKVKVRALKGSIKSPWSQIYTIKTKSKAKKVKSSVYAAWKGAFSERLLTRTISHYSKYCSEIVLHNAEEASALKVKVGKGLSAGIPRLSRADGNYEEIDGYVDMIPKYDYNGSKGVLNLDASWWYGDDKTDTETWSYLIKLDKDSGTEYKYFRLIYLNDGN